VRQRRRTPGEIAATAAGHALLVRGASSKLIRTTPYYAREPWSSLAGGGAPEYAPSTGAMTAQRAA